MHKTKRSSDKFSYPHPIVKCFGSVAQEWDSISPQAYQNSHTCDPKMIPSKLLRPTHIYPLLGSSFSLLLHPLHPNLEIDCFQTKHVLKCKNCHARLNSSSMHKLSLFQHKCKFCASLLQSEFESGRYVDITVLDEVPDPVLSNSHSQRCYLFAIEANEHLYNKNVTTQIFQCLRALASQQMDDLDKSVSEETERTSEQNVSSSIDFKIGFLLFDGERNYLMNMASKQLIVISSSDFKSPRQFPLTQSELFQPISSVNLQQLEQIIDSLMYESYIIPSACLLSTLQICDMLARTWNVETKLFALSYDKEMTTRGKNSKQRKEPSLHINPRVQLNIFSLGLYQDLTHLGLFNNLCNFYDYNKVCHTDIYYDLFHNLTQQIHYDVEVSVLTSNLITQFKPIQQISILTSSRPIILDFWVSSKIQEAANSQGKGKEALSSQCIQIRLKFADFQRVITYSLPSIGTNLLYEPYVLNDQAFFHVMLYKFLMDASTSSVTKAIQLKSKEIVRRIMNTDDQQFSVPKNLVNFFMYSFLLTEHQHVEQNSKKCLPQKDFFLKQGLETIVKKLYPKVYQFYPELRPLKFRPKSFLHNTIRLVDNGRCVALVIGDQVPTQTLIKLLNIRDIDDGLGLRDIPVLQTELNRRLRDSVALLRQLNQLHFLSFRVIRLDSTQFEEEYGNFLYTEEDHRKFFLKLLKD